jgi:hypothetical protein
MHRQHHQTAAHRTGLSPSRSEHHLRAVLEAGWSDIEALHPRERQRARSYYAGCHRHRLRLAAVQQTARSACQQWTAQWAHPMGSSYAGTALPGSDIDLYACIPAACPDLTALEELLHGRAAYQKTRPGPTGQARHLFTYQHQATKIDLNFVPPADYQLALTVVHEISASMTDDDRVAHTWIKYLLHQRQDFDAYDQWKTAMRLRGSTTLRRLLSTGPTETDPADAPPPLPCC